MVKYCFICSAARSGSTLFDILLGGHSSVSSLGEFSFLGKSIALNQNCSCGSKVIDCKMWAKVFRHIRIEKNIDLLENPYELFQWDAQAGVNIDRNVQTKLYLFNKKMRSLLCDVYYRLPNDVRHSVLLPKTILGGIDNSIYLYDVVREVCGSQLIIDSSKNVHKAISVYNRTPNSTRIIYLTRDGRGVYFSRRTSGFSKNDSVSGWYKYNKRASVLLGKSVPPAHFLQIKYEDLVSDLHGVLDTVCRFLDLDYEENMCDFGYGERHLVNGNDTMFHRSRGVVADERWRNGIDDIELRYFYNKCESLNVKLGYKL